MKMKIYVTPKQAEWCKRNLDFDPYKTEGYEIMETPAEVLDRAFKNATKEALGLDKVSS